jgi:hypothetical protein
MAAGNPARIIRTDIMTDEKARLIDKGRPGVQGAALPVD